MSGFAIFVGRSELNRLHHLDFLFTTFLFIISFLSQLSSKHILKVVLIKDLYVYNFFLFIIFIFFLPIFSFLPVHFLWGWALNVVDTYWRFMLYQGEDWQPWSVDNAQEVEGFTETHIKQKWRVYQLLCSTAAVGKMREKLMDTGFLRGGIFAGIQTVLVSWWFGIINAGACCS